MVKPGTVLQGRYRVEQKIGQGGMGVVYLARQVRLADRPVAIKEMVLPSKDPQEYELFSRQFTREARILAALSHSGLVDVKDFFEEDGSMFLAMEYVEGSNLAQLTKAPPGLAGVLQILGWAQQLVDVFIYLHDHDPPIVVRDLKPANIMLESSGRIRLIDFGIAREYRPNSPFTTQLRVTGSAGYAPPEQYAGKTDRRSDIYSFGATLYALLAAKLPVSALGRVGGFDVLRPVQELNESVCPELGHWINRVMALRTDERPQTMQRIQEELQTVIAAQERFAGTSLTTSETVASAASHLTAAPPSPLYSAPTTAMLPTSPEVDWSPWAIETPEPVAVSKDLPSDVMSDTLVVPTPPDAPYYPDQTLIVEHPPSGGIDADLIENAPTDSPPASAWPTPLTIAVLLGLVVVSFLLVKSAHRIDPPPPPRPAPVAGQTTSATQTAEEPYSYSDAEGQFRLTVPSGWRYGEADPSLPGVLPPFTRFATSSLLRRQYAAVECFQGCASVPDAISLMKTYLTSQGEVTQVAPLAEPAPAGEAYTVSLTIGDRPVVGHLYFRQQESRIWCLSLWCSGTTFEDANDTLKSVLSSYSLTPSSSPSP